jgi:hypothetical protein
VVFMAASSGDEVDFVSNVVHSAVTDDGSILKLSLKAVAFTDSVVYFELANVILDVFPRDGCKTPLYLHKFLKGVQHFESAFEAAQCDGDPLLPSYASARQNHDQPLHGKTRQEYQISPVGLVAALAFLSYKRKGTESSRCRLALRCLIEVMEPSKDDCEQVWTECVNNASHLCTVGIQHGRCAHARMPDVLVAYEAFESPSAWIGGRLVKLFAMPGASSLPNHMGIKNKNYPNICVPDGNVCLYMKCYICLLPWIYGSVLKHTHCTFVVYILV